MSHIKTFRIADNKESVAPGHEKKLEEDWVGKDPLICQLWCTNKTKQDNKDATDDGAVGHCWFK